MIQCKFREFLIQLCTKKAFWGVRAEILLTGDKAYQDSRAGPSLGFVQKYKFLEKYTPLVHPIMGLNSPKKMGVKKIPIKKIKKT